MIFLKKISPKFVAFLSSLKIRKGSNGRLTFDADSYCISCFSIGSPSRTAQDSRIGMVPTWNVFGDGLTSCFSCLWIEKTTEENNVKRKNK